MSNDSHHAEDQARRVLAELKTVVEGLEARLQHVTKQDLINMEHRIIMKIEEAIAAASALSTATDSLSIKLDTLVGKADQMLDLFQNAGNLTPEQEAAVAAFGTAKDAAVAAGDKADAEVAKLDKILPTPAPAGK